VAVKAKFAYAYTQEFPYRIQHILECEFFLLEAMVTEANAYSLPLPCLWTLTVLDTIFANCQSLAVECCISDIAIDEVVVIEKLPKFCDNSACGPRPPNLLKSRPKYRITNGSLWSTKTQYSTILQLLEESNTVC